MKVQHAVKFGKKWRMDPLNNSIYKTPFNSFRQIYPQNNILKKDLREVKLSLKLTLCSPQSSYIFQVTPCCVLWCKILFQQAAILSYILFSNISI